VLSTPSFSEFDSSGRCENNESLKIILKYFVLTIKVNEFTKIPGFINKVKMINGSEEVNLNRVLN